MCSSQYEGLTLLSFHIHKIILLISLIVNSISGMMLDT